MKTFYFLTIVIVAAFFQPCVAQLNNGGIYASFGVDGDTRAGYAKYGPVQGLVSSDDWFSPQFSGYNIIDTSNAAFYSALLQSGANASFVKRMSSRLYSKLGNKLWLDAVYGRDYIATNPLFDSTAFTIACKNGDNPGNWVGGSTSFPDKNDLVDVFAHMRRDGVTVHDSLWLFTGVSTVGTSGSRYFDIELYKNSFNYNFATGVFTTGGPDAGHTQWKFDAAGNIIQTGDMIIAVNFSPGSAPAVDVRLWVSQATFTSVIPAYFNFGGSFDGATAAFGYASILSKTGTTAFGAGMSNYSVTPPQDTTYSTPWGTEGASKSWVSQYESLQLVEVGLNLTRIGVDPALYSALGLNPCQSLFSSIFFKSRSSNSFTSNMQDFVVPLDFLTFPAMDYSLLPDTLRCNRPVGNITITNNTTAGYYSWKTTTGNISGSSADSSSLTINKPGTYIVSASPAEGCPVSRTDTVVIPIDTFPPVASFYVTSPDVIHLLLHGGDTAASNYPTPFGGSKGLLWDWSGPAGFTSTIQNPLSDNNSGTYQLIVTEKRNGCKDTVAQFVSFSVLPVEGFVLTGSYFNSAVTLKWKIETEATISFFEIEKETAIGFSTIGTVMVSDVTGVAGRSFSFADSHPGLNTNFYRIKAVGKNGKTVYSNITGISKNAGGDNQFFISRGTDNNSLSLNANILSDMKASLVIYNTAGALILKKDLQLSKGQNRVSLELSELQKNKIIIIGLLNKNEWLFSQKIIF